MPWAHGRAHEGGHRRRAAPGGPVRTLRAAGERRAGARRGARGFWDFGLRPSCRENGPPSAEAAPRCTARSPWRGSVRMARPAENAGRVPLRPRASYPSLARRASRRRCKSSTCAARPLSRPCPASTPVWRMQSRRAGLQGRHARCRFFSPPPSPSCRLVRIVPPAPRAHLCARQDCIALPESSPWRYSPKSSTSLRPFIRTILMAFRSSRPPIIVLTPTPISSSRSTCDGTASP